MRLGKNTEENEDSDDEPDVSQADAAKMLNVSTRSVTAAKAVQKNGSKALQELMTADLIKAGNAATLAKNQFGRRNLQPFQRAELALKIEPLIAEAAAARMRRTTTVAAVPTLAQGPKTSGKTRDVVADMAQVSHDTIDRAKKIVAEADDKTKADLRAGKTSINAAYRRHLTQSHDVTALADLGITKMQSSRWQAVASEEVGEAALVIGTCTKNSEGRLTDNASSCQHVVTATPTSPAGASSRRTALESRAGVGTPGWAVSVRGIFLKRGLDGGNRRFYQKVERRNESHDVDDDNEAEFPHAHVRIVPLWLLAEKLTGSYSLKEARVWLADRKVMYRTEKDTENSCAGNLPHDLDGVNVSLGELDFRVGPPKLIAEIRAIVKRREAIELELYEACCM